VPTLRALHDPDIREEWQRIEAIASEKDIAEKLEIRTGSPTLVVKRLFVDSQRKPVVYFETIYRADRYYYSVELPRAKSAKPRTKEPQLRRAATVTAKRRSKAK
jgi:DNA-binding GntR family transcriptional regulator